MFCNFYQNIFLFYSFLFFNKWVIAEHIFESKHNDLNYDLSQYILPSLQIILFVNPYNKVNVLPFVISGIQKQNYDKSRINIFIRTEIFQSVNNGIFNKKIRKFRDNEQTIRILKKWMNSVKEDYHLFDLKIDEISDDEDDIIVDYWSVNRYTRLMSYKKSAFFLAKKNWANFALYIDSDVILTDENCLFYLIDSSKNKILVSPMLYSLGTYSNFWSGMNDKGYYVRTDDYLKILERNSIGSFEVPMIHSCVLINLNFKKSSNLKFVASEVKDSPFDDIIAFSFSAKENNVSMYIDNNKIYGYIMPPIETYNYDEQLQNLIDLESESVSDNGKLFYVATELQQFINRPIKDKLGVDNIYIINLKRRKEKKLKMLATLEALGIEAEFWPAVDGKSMTKQSLIENKIHVLDNYLDPFHKRPMTYGEIGCFLSHYNIWKDIIKNNYSTAIIFEDDIHFEQRFKKKLQKVILSIDFSDKVDFVYLGRKREGDAKEEVWYNEFLVIPTYSYWTIGYILSKNGAKKLIDQNPLRNLLPVDEFLPIMYDSHSNLEWKNVFSNRNLKALSVYPLLVHPVNYIGQEAYISDTEDSITIFDEQKQINHEEL